MWDHPLGRLVTSTEFKRELQSSCDCDSRAPCFLLQADGTGNIMQWDLAVGGTFSNNKFT